MYNYLIGNSFSTSSCLTLVSVAGRIMVNNMEGNHDLIRGNAPSGTEQCQREPQKREKSFLFQRLAKFFFFFFFLFSLRDSHPVGHGLLIHKFSRSHTFRRTTVGRTSLDE